MTNRQARNNPRHRNPPGPWSLQGLCRTTPGDWFPPDNHPNPPAKVICQQCPVKQQCLDHAIQEHEEHGIWGATTERERQRIWRKMRTMKKAS